MNLVIDIQQNFFFGVVIGLGVNWLLIIKPPNLFGNTSRSYKINYIRLNCEEASPYCMLNLDLRGCKTRHLYVCINLHAFEALVFFIVCPSSLRCPISFFENIFTSIGLC